MSLKLRILKRSLWVYHLATGPCNNCDIEILDLLTPRHDVERFGIKLVGSVRHADVLLVTGIVNRKCVPRVLRVYDQMPAPKVVVAVGACPMEGCVFKGSYNQAGPLDKIIPVDLYIPGCPPKPEAIIAGIAKLLERFK